MTTSMNTITVDRTTELARFGLRDGQFGRDRIAHNGGWYTADGVKLGLGDLGHDDVANIATVLDDGEMFVVLREGASYWNYDTNTYGGNDIMNPGRQYIAEHCQFIITNTANYLASDYDGHEATVERDGITFNVVSRAHARTLLGV